MPGYLRSLALVALATPAAAAQEPTEARLTIGEEVYNVPLGKAFAVRIGGERLTLRIDPQTDRSFDASGVAFRYPRSLTLSEDTASRGVTVWTMQGPNAAIMLQRYEEGLDPQSLLDVLVSNLVGEGDDGPKQQGVKLTGAQRAYQGVQVQTETPAADGRPATEGVQNVFTFANQAGVFALMVQDVHAAGDEPSEEYREALRLLGESLTTGEEPAAPATEPGEDRRPAAPQPPR